MKGCPWQFLWAVSAIASTLIKNFNPTPPKSAYCPGWALGVGLVSENVKKQSKNSNYSQISTGLNSTSKIYENNG